jgi:hypothetical protein
LMLVRVLLLLSYVSILLPELLLNRKISQNVRFYHASDKFINSIVAICLVL